MTYLGQVALYTFVYLLTYLLTYFLYSFVLFLCNCLFIYTLEICRCRHNDRLTIQATWSTYWLITYLGQLHKQHTQKSHQQTQDYPLGRSFYTCISQSSSMSEMLCTTVALCSILNSNQKNPNLCSHVQYTLHVYTGLFPRHVILNNDYSCTSVVTQH